MPSEDPPPNRREPSRARVGVAFAEVLAAAQADAPWAYERLYAAYGGPVAGYLRAQGAEDPDSLANDVFLRAFANLCRFDGGEPQFRSWLFTIAHHRLLDDRRRRSRRPVRADEPVQEAQVGVASGAEDEALAALGGLGAVRFLERLSPDQRDVLVLRILGDLTIEEVARAVGKRPGAVKALQRRGLATLRRMLEAGS